MACVRCRGTEEVTFVLADEDGYPRRVVQTCPCVQERADREFAEIMRTPLPTRGRTRG